MYKGKRLFSARVAATAGTTVGAQVYQHNAMKLSPAQNILSIVLHAQSSCSNSLFWNYKAVLEL